MAKMLMKRRKFYVIHLFRKKILRFQQMPSYTMPLLTLVGKQQMNNAKLHQSFKFLSKAMRLKLRFANHPKKKKKWLVTR